jgi:transcription termination factor Rho
MEVILDRKLADKRVFPAIDITRSGTRREELLLSEKELDAIWLLRKTFTQLETAAVTETMLGLLLKTRSNDQFISSINVSLADKSLFDAMRGGMPKRD